jgi:hypothetical protein
VRPALITILILAAGPFAGADDTQKTDGGASGALFERLRPHLAPLPPPSDPDPKELFGDPPADPFSAESSHKADATREPAGLGAFGGSMQAPLPPSPAPRRLPTVTLLEPTVGPGLDREVVRRIVWHHIATVEQCYAEVRSQMPARDHRIGLALTVGRDGQVVSAAAAGGDPATICLVQGAKRWRFPKPTTRAVRVKCVFLFQAADRAGGGT